MATDTDQIHKQVHIAAPVERVWELITRPEHLGRWFANAGATIDLRPGGTLTLTWDGHGTTRGRVEAVEPPHRLAFRWLATMGVDDEPRPGNSTLVEFTLAGDGDGTLVTVVESAFALLEFDVAERTAAFASHTRGWESELADLAAHAAAVGA